MPTNLAWQSKLISVLDRVLNCLPNKSEKPFKWEHVFAAEWVALGGVGFALPGQLVPIQVDLNVSLDDIIGLDAQKDKAVINTQQFVNGFPANNVLLWGSRGTGKSTLVKALLNEFHGDGLRVVQLSKENLAQLSSVVGALVGLPFRFVVFCDDLSFGEDNDESKALKSVLEGSLFSIPENVIVYATSNRRHLVPEYRIENSESQFVDDQLHHGDVVEEKISLSDRFGISLSFYPISQDSYLRIARHWSERMAALHEVTISWDATIEKSCLRWALSRGGRSGRVAQQFARHCVGLRKLEVVNSTPKG